MWKMRRGTISLCLFWWALVFPAQGEPAAETYYAEAPVPNAPTLLLFIPRETTVDLGLEFFSIEQIVVHATFVENLLDPGEALRIHFGNLSFGFRTTETVDRISADVTNLARTHLKNGTSDFRVSIDSPGNALLSSLLVEVRAAPLPDTEDILTCIEDWSDAGTLSGLGPGRSGPGRLVAFQSMIDAAGSMIDAENQSAACDQLLDALVRADGVSAPPDFVTGESTTDLVEQVESLLRELRCDVISWGFEAEVTSSREALFTEGDVWEGTITYEPSTPGSPLGSPSTTDYLEAVLEAQLTHGETTVVFEPVRREGGIISVTNGAQPGFPDRLRMNAWNATVWQGGQVIETLPGANFGLIHRDFDGSMFADTSMPLVPPALSPLRDQGLIINLDFANQTASFRFHSLFLVPESAP